MMQKKRKPVKIETLSQEDIERLKPMPNMVLAKFDFKGGLIDEIEINNGKASLYFDPSYEKQWNASPWCTVIKAPDRLFVSQKSRDRSLDWETDIEISVGDRILIEYYVVTNALKLADYEKGGAYIVGDDLYILFRYDAIVLKMVGDTVVPINGFVLATPTEEKIDTTLAVPDTAKKQSERVFRITHVGRPVKRYINEPDMHDTDEVRVGDLVRLRGKVAYQLERDIHRQLDQEYYKFQRKHIVGIYDEQKTEK